MVNFSTQEVRDIIISMLVISLAFAYLFSGRNIEVLINNSTVLIPITLIAVGLGFVLHELAHKFVAIKYGFYAEYRLWPAGLLLAVVSAFFGFIFAAPGAVYIHGEYISREENGKISIAGALTNLILAAIFLSLALIFPYIPFLLALGSLGFAINSFLAFFNLLPLGILDGAKVFKWNPIIWGAAIGIALLMVVYSLIG